MDFINLKGIKVFGHHGVLKEEKEKGQNFIVDIKLFMSTEAAGRSDDLTGTVNYAELAEFVADSFDLVNYDLIEAVAENLSYGILKKYPLIAGIELTVNKPEAPIPVAFENVSVTVRRKWHRVYIAVGSNMGNSEEIIKAATDKLSAMTEFKNVRSSELIVTKPYGYTDQPDFVNGMLEADTVLSPEALLIQLNKVEAEAGRERLIHWGPRTLDLDIIYYDSLVMSNEKLTIPHADMENRLFVLEPLNELNPYIKHPRSHKTASEMIESINRTDNKQV